MKVLMMSFSLLVLAGFAFLGSPALPSYFNSGHGTAVDRSIPAIEVQQIAKSAKVQYPRTGNNWVFLYAGYSTCGMVCPATIGKLRKLSRLTGNHNVSYHFFTVSPESDGVEELQRWSNANHGIFQVFRPLSSREAANFVRSLCGRTSWMAREDPQHTDFVYLLDPAGRLRMVYADPGVTAGEMHQDLVEIRNDHGSYNK